MRPTTHYQAYLIRAWAEEDEEKSAWRYRLQNVQTGEQFGFVSLDELFHFLNEKFVDEVEPSADE